ncbi:cupin domain-containing protein [Streptomyces sp. NPDC006539]|uniref:JmjC domain-containing protein n=1 Tax=Streptomyces sp. NPDC006539 TaxID=3155352 RepID=UPI0033ABC86D
MGESEFSAGDEGADRNIGGSVSARKIGSLLASGATLQVNQLPRMWAPVARFCRRLSFETGLPVDSRLHLTPPSSWSFPYHYDGFSAFIVQLSGSKAWDLYSPELENPVVRDGVRAGKEALDRFEQEDPTLSVTLSPGDVLWMPRGWFHKVSTDDQPSLHINFEFWPITRYWLAQQLLQHLGEPVDEFSNFRRALPPGIARDREKLAAVTSEVALEMSRVLADMSTDPVSVRSMAEIRKMFRSPILAPAVSLSPTAVGVDTPVVMVSESAISVERAAEGSLKMDFGDSTLLIKEPAATLIGNLWKSDSGQPWSARMLMSDLSEGVAVGLVRRLMRAGLVCHA